MQAQMNESTYIYTTQINKRSILIVDKTTDLDHWVQRGGWLFQPSKEKKTFGTQVTNSIGYFLEFGLRAFSFNCWAISPVLWSNSRYSLAHLWLWDVTYRKLGSWRLQSQRVPTSHERGWSGDHQGQQMYSQGSGLLMTMHKGFADFSLHTSCSDCGHTLLHWVHPS